MWFFPMITISLCIKIIIIPVMLKFGSDIGTLFIVFFAYFGVSVTIETGVIDPIVMALSF